MAVFPLIICLGNYKLPLVSVHTKNPNLSWLTNGDFYIKGNDIVLYIIYLSFFLLLFIDSYRSYLMGYWM